MGRMYERKNVRPRRVCSDSDAHHKYRANRKIKTEFTLEIMMARQIDFEPIRFTEQDIYVDQGGGPKVRKRVQSIAARALAKALEHVEPDAVVMFAVMLPSGKTIWAGVHGLITDYDGTGNCAVLLDKNVQNVIARGS